MKSVVYEKALEFVKKYPSTITWRLKSHCNVINKHLNNDEKVLYVFCGQFNSTSIEFFHTAVFVITDKRLMIATDRVLFGYFFYSITPDMFNDLTVMSNLIWGKVIIDTIKEEVVISNISKKALDEIETMVTKYIMEEKKKYTDKKNDKKA